MWGNNQVYVKGYLETAPLFKIERTAGWINMIATYAKIKLPFNPKKIAEIKFNATKNGIRFTTKGIDFTPIIPKKFKAIKRSTGTYYQLDSEIALIQQKDQKALFGTPSLITENNINIHPNLKKDFPPEKEIFFKLSTIVPESFKKRFSLEDLKKLPHPVVMLIQNLKKIEITASKGDKSTLFIVCHLTPEIAQELRLYLNTFLMEMKPRVMQELTLIDLRKDQIFKKRFGKAGLKRLAPIPNELKIAYNNIKIMSDNDLLTIQTTLSPDLALITPMVALAIGIPAFYRVSKK